MPHNIGWQQMVREPGEVVAQLALIP